MDAKITKQRLGNLLSYDWLKILAAVVAAVAVLTLLFTMIGTRPTEAQTFSVYCYNGLNAGKDYSSLESSLENRKVFSYEILSIGAEDFTDSKYANSLYTTRRSAGEGTVMFVADTPKNKEDGSLDESSTPLTRMSTGFAYNGSNERSGFYDTVYYMNDCKSYLEAFFGKDFTAESPLDKAKAKEHFLARNGKDKRFRSAEKKQAGIAQEEERLIQLKGDYLAVRKAFEEGKFSHISYTTSQGTYNFGISVSALPSIQNLVFTRSEDGAATGENAALMIFYNDRGKGNDLRFETVSFLRYLTEKYGE